MMFSQTAEYALRATVALAQDSEKPLTTDQIARRTKVPAGYLSKVLQKLSRKGLIIALRGKWGGYRLSTTAENITILEVVNAVDPIKRINTCPLDIKEHGKKLCPLHKRMDTVLADAQKALSITTLAEVIQEPADSIPLCPGPGRTAATE